MPESRRDAAQEVFLAAFRGLDGFQIPQRFRTWLLGIVAGLPIGWMLVFALRHHEGWCNERGLGPR